MIENLTRLDEILQIPDRDQRREALEHLGEEIGVFSIRKPAKGGQYNEERLVLAVYDGLIACQKERMKNRQFFIKTFLIFLVVVLLLAIVPKRIVSYFRFLAASNRERLKSFEGYDEHGELIRDEKGKPVVFQEMSGYYDEYYSDGNLHYTYLYKDGKVVEEVEYDRKGNVIVHLVYDEQGNPQLKKGR